MAWYWIILGIIVYFVIMFLTGIFYYFIYGVDSEEASVCGLFWPIVLPLGLLGLPVLILRDFLDSLL